MPPRHATPPHSPPSTQPHLITAPPSSQIYPHHHPHLPPHSPTSSPLHPPSTQPTSPPRPAEFIACFFRQVFSDIPCPPPSPRTTFPTVSPLHPLHPPPSALHYLPLIPHPKQKKVSTSQSGPFRINNIIYFMVKSICQRHPRHIACLHHMPTNATPRPCKPCRQ